MTDKSQVRAARARAARARWDADSRRAGQAPGPRRVRLDDLDEDTRLLVVTLVDLARKNAKAKATTA